MRMVPFLGVTLKFVVSFATLGLLVVRAFLKGCVAAVTSGRRGHVEHSGLSPFLATSGNGDPLRADEERDRLDLNGNAPFHRGQSFPENAVSFIRAEDLGTWALRRRQGHGVSLPSINLHWASRRVALRTSLILVATLSAAFVVFLCARHFGGLGRSGPRLLAGDAPSGACGVTEDFPVSLEVSETIKEKIFHVLRLVEELADSCEDVLDKAPINARIKGAQLMLGSASQELAALAVVLGENMKDQRNAAAERVLAAAGELIRKDPVMRNNIKAFKKLLIEVKKKGPGPAQVPQKERSRLLEELLELQVVGLGLQIAGVKNLLPPDAEGAVSLTPEQLKQKAESYWGSVTMTRRYQLFSTPLLSDWLRRKQKKGCGQGVLIKPSTAEELKQAGPPAPLAERIQQLYTASTGSIRGNIWVFFQPKTNRPLEKAAAAFEKRQPSGSEYHGVLPKALDAAGQAALQAAATALHPPHAPSDPPAARNQQTESAPSGLLQQTLEPSRPLIGLPFSLMSALSLPHVPSPSSVELSSEQALLEERQPSGSEYRGVLHKVLDDAPSDPPAARNQQTESACSSLLQQTLEPSRPLIGLPFSLMSALSLPHVPSPSSVDLSSEQALFPTEPPQQAPAGTVSASVDGVLADTPYTPRAPKAPYGPQPSFKGHPLGEPSPREIEGQDSQIHPQIL